MRYTQPRKGAVLITGASSGIGRASALKLAQSGYHVFAGVRKQADAESLLQQSSSLLVPILLDVTNEKSIAATVTQIVEAVREIGLIGVVNNAGITVPGPLEVIPLSELRRQFEVNVIGPVAVTQAVLPLLRKTQGRIINVGSVGSSMTFPFAGALSASKSALEAVNDALRIELLPWGVKVILITPSTTRTPGVEKLQQDSEKMLQIIPEEDARHYATSFRAFVDIFTKQEALGSPPEDVADVILLALTTVKPKSEYPIGRGSRILPLLARLLPTKLLDKLRVKALGLSRQREDL